MMTNGSLMPHWDWHNCLMVLTLLFQGVLSLMSIKVLKSSKLFP